MTTDMSYMKPYFTFVFIILGAVTASFFNCAAMRYAAGEDFLRGRSKCPRCGHTLGPAELVPVVSWLVLRGRCRHCRGKISVRYPVTELIGALAFAGAYLRFGLTLYTAELVILFSLLLFLALIDYETMLLPDALMLAALLCWCIFLPAHADWKTRALAGVLTAAVVFAVILALSLLMDRILGRESLGGGDLKLMALTGLYLGPLRAVLMLFVSSVLALVFAVATNARDRQFPFGPALCAGTALVLLFGDPFVAWYFGI